MMDDTERLFFEHDLATPLTNLNGGHYLLSLYIKEPSPEIKEALRVIESSSRTLERMLGWYWRTRRLKETLQLVEPWSLEGLTSRLEKRIEEEKLPLEPPVGSPGDLKTSLPVDEFETALLGVGLTLLSATKMVPEWTIEPGEEACFIKWRIVGEQDLIDRDRLLRKVFLPSFLEVAAWLDPGLPYMEVLLDKVGGAFELDWKDNTWFLSARLPILR